MWSKSQIVKVRFVTQERYRVSQNVAVAKLTRDVDTMRHRWVSIQSGRRLWSIQKSTADFNVRISSAPYRDVNQCNEPSCPRFHALPTLVWEECCAEKLQTILTPQTCASFSGARITANWLLCKDLVTENIGYPRAVTSLGNRDSQLPNPYTVTSLLCDSADFALER